MIQKKFDAAFQKARDVAKEKMAGEGEGKNSIDSKTMEKIVRTALAAIGWSRFVRAGVLKIFNTALQFLYPICVNGILLYVESGSKDSSTPAYVGYAWAIAPGDGHVP